MEDYTWNDLMQRSHPTKDKDSKSRNVLTMDDVLSETQDTEDDEEIDVRSLVSV